MRSSFFFLTEYKVMDYSLYGSKEKLGKIIFGLNELHFMG